jgi:hypothetical protein
MGFMGVDGLQLTSLDADGTPTIATRIDPISQDRPSLRKRSALTHSPHSLLPNHPSRRIRVVLARSRGLLPVSRTHSFEPGGFSATVLLSRALRNHSRNQRASVSQAPLRICTPTNGCMGRRASSSFRSDGLNPRFTACHKLLVLFRAVVDAYGHQMLAQAYPGYPMCLRRDSSTHLPPSHA